MPTGKGLGDAVRRGKAIGCTAVQVFTSSPQQWKSKPITDEMATSLRTAAEKTGINAHLVSHDSYLINLAAVEPEKRDMSREALARELARCAQLGIPYVVSHMGAHSGQGEEVGIAKVVEATREILAEVPPGVTLLMETTAGQGSSLNYKFEQISEILSRLPKTDQIAVCLDTCHIFAAGYDIRTPEAYEATFAEFERLVGCDRIKVIHVNDSKKPLGSRVDRHDHLGDGEIGAEAFRCLVNDPRWTETMLVVETPDAETMHEENVRRLWAWRD